MKKFRIREELYGFPVILCIGEWKDFRKFAKRKYSTKFKRNGIFAGRAEMIADKKTGFYVVLIWVSGFDWSPEAYGDLVHETVHSAIDVLDRIGVPVSRKNDEALCYLVDWYFRNIMKKLIKYKEKCMKKNSQ